MFVTRVRYDVIGSGNADGQGTPEQMRELRDARNAFEGSAAWLARLFDNWRRCRRHRADALVPGRIQLFTSVVTYFEIWTGIVASGSNPNIVMTTTAALANFDVYCRSGLSATPVDQVARSSASGTSCAINDVKTKVGGALIAGVAAQGTGASVTEAGLAPAAWWRTRISRHRCRTRRPQRPT
ncbi:hypothetical protein [Mesorhizobium argentiipisi]|uniref:Uncharacterized protein n=1 Tax=Mesorhizobium argentiipisi TaxID=3015175 RepID=A0ABU8KD39_9HYPH